MTYGELIAVTKEKTDALHALLVDSPHQTLFSKVDALKTALDANQVGLASWNLVVCQLLTEVKKHQHLEAVPSDLAPPYAALVAYAP